MGLSAFPAPLLTHRVGRHCSAHTCAMTGTRGWLSHRLRVLHRDVYVQTEKREITGNRTPGGTDTWVTSVVPVVPEKGFPDVTGGVESYPTTAPVGYPGDLKVHH